MSQLTYTVPVLGSTGWGVTLNAILEEIKITFNNLEGTTYTASRALVSDANGKVAVSTTTSAELGYLSGVTSAIQTQLNGKQASITGGATTITSSDLTASRALISNADGKVAASSITSTKLGYLTDVTSNIQAQIDGKASSASPALTGTPTAPTAASTVNNTQIATTAYVVAHRCTTAATTTSSASIYKPAIVVENYKNGDAWYRKWSDGWIEQGGYTIIPSTSTNVTVNLNKAFSGTGYQVLLTVVSDGSLSQLYPYSNFANKTTSSFKVQFYTNNGFYWKACGY